MRGELLHALEFPLPPPGEDIVGQVQVIQAKYEDTFADLGTKYDLGYLEMTPPTRAWTRGCRVLARTLCCRPASFCRRSREGIVINLAEYRMYYYPKGQNVVHTYPLASVVKVGGRLSVCQGDGQDPEPDLDTPCLDQSRACCRRRSVAHVVPAGPDNPLGPFKFGLGLSGYLIHGSNKKFGIGMRTSHGCFRMYNNNVLELADMAPVGTTVRIISEPYKFGLSGGKVYLEAHTPVEDLGNPSVVDKHTAVINALLKRDDLANNLRMNWDMVRDVVAAEDACRWRLQCLGSLLQERKSRTSFSRASLRIHAGALS
ncbi:L,D-transpeptidase family protein, partial [Pseudomonas syringae pv. actinidiae]|nr:L,D-transpeptidase family protein [Pseudomonas syringae pv. actinidiae]